MIKWEMTVLVVDDNVTTVITSLKKEVNDLGKKGWEPYDSHRLAPTLQDDGGYNIKYIIFLKRPIGEIE